MKKCELIRKVCLTTRVYGTICATSPREQCVCVGGGGGYSNEDRLQRVELMC